MTKICTKCKEEKSVLEFGKDCSKSDGLRSSCRACKKITDSESHARHREFRNGAKKNYRKNNLELIKAQSKASYEKHKDARQAKNKEWTEQNPEKTKQIKHDWYLANKGKTYESRVVSSKEWKAKNKDKIKEYNRDYAQNNKGIMNAKTMKRHTAKLQRTPAWANLDAIKQFYIKASKMSEKLGEIFHVDHIVPLQGEIVSGLHVENNLQILTASDNIKKSNNF